jgi:hypothetical protein
LTLAALLAVFSRGVPIGAALLRYCDEPEFGSV